MSSFTFLGKEIPYYGLLWLTGIVVAGLVAIPLARKKMLDIFDLCASACYAVILGGVGAKILFIIVSYKQIIEYNIPLENIIKGGFVFYGGLIGGFFGLLIYIKQFKRKAAPFFDVFAVVLPLGHAFGRVGCFFAGCCYGMEYDGLFSYTYTQPTAGLTPIGVPLLPVQLIEAALLLLLSIVLIIILCKYPNKEFLTPKIYVCSYSVIRFVLEFFRGDKERGSAFALSTSQWISIVLILVCILISIVQNINAKNKCSHIQTND